MYKILIIEDDRTIANVLAEHRRAYAFRGTMDVLEHAGVMLKMRQ